MRKTLLLAWAALSGAALFATDVRPLPKVSIPQVEKAPAIDGKIDDECWRDASWITGFARGDKPAYDQTWASMVYDGDNIYFAFKCRQTNLKKLTAKYHKFQEPVCFDNDALEIFLQADPQGSPKKYFQIYINSEGVHGMTAIGYDGKANFAECRSAAGRGEDCWLLEIAIPFKVIGAPPPAPGSLWRMSVCRDNTINGEQTSWCNSGFHTPPTFGELAFSKRPPCVSIESMGDLFWGANSCKLKIGNPGDAPLQVQGGVRISRGDWAMSEQSEFKESLPPLAFKELSLRYNCWNDDLNAFVLSVGSGANEDSYRAVIYFNPPVFDATVSRIENLLKAFDGLPKVARDELRGYGPLLERLKLKIPSLKDKRISKGEFESLAADASRIESAIVNAWCKSTGGDFRLIVRGSMEKLFNDKRLFFPLPLPAEQGVVRLSAAGNESESFQAVIYPVAERDLKDVSVSVSALDDGQGNTIQAENVKPYLTGYVKVGLPPGLMREIGTNIYPDPLIPCSKKPSFDVKAGSICPVWVTADVPANAKAGEYSGDLTVKASGAESRLKIKLKVRGFSLPKTPHLKTAFQCFCRMAPGGPGTFDYWYPTAKFNQDDVYRKIYGLFGEHKSNSDIIGLIHQSGNGNLDKTMEMVKFASGKGSNAIGIYNMWKGMTPDTPKQLKGYIERLRQEGLEKNAFIYLWDEPKSSHFPKIVSNANLLKEACPGVRRLVTVRPTPELFGAVDLWCPWGWGESPLFDERRKAGDEIWSYVCSPVPGHYSPHVSADYPGIYHRIMFWLCWKYQRTGLLLPGVDLGWEKSDLVATWPAATWDISTAWGNEGKLLYPTADGDVMPSLRLEIIRDGIEDYEYLHILKSIGDGIRARGGSPAELKEIEDTLSLAPVVLSNKAYTRDAGELVKYRERVGDLIEREMRRNPVSVR